jgi:hypothetical protein
MRSPMRTLVTLDPTASTRPAPSTPMTAGSFGKGVKSDPVIDVDEIYSNDGLADLDLGWPRRRDVTIHGL